MSMDVQEDKITDAAAEIKKALADDGFMLCRTDPFFDWMHGQKTPACSSDEAGLSFYIVNPPVAPVAPFDFASLYVSLERPERGKIFFQLTFYFCRDLAQCLEADEINKVYNKHNRRWFNQLADSLAEIEQHAELSWETAYDETIEDRLYGSYSLAEKDRIIMIMKMLKII